MRFKIILFAFMAITLFGGYEAKAQFGKNKVQYRTFNWKYISTKHFDIYYDDGSKYMAQFAANEAENALVKIQRIVGYRIDKRIAMLLYDSQNDFQQTNIISEYMSEGIQGVTELFKNRVVLPFLGDYAQFRHVIHHELVHAVLNQYLYGGTFQTSLQTGQRIQFPLWMNEGLAEFSSIGGQDVANDMFIRDLAVSEKLKGLDNFNGYLAYRGGQTFYWYVSEKYGEEKISELIQKLKLGYTINAAFQNVFKMEYSDFSDQFVKDLKKYYWPDVEKYKAPDDFSERITNHKKEGTFYNTSPAISPDGSTLAYISDQDGLYAIFTRKIDEKKPRPKKLVSSFRSQDFEELNLLTPSISWSPDGKKLAVSAKAGGEDAIFIIDVENGDYEKHYLGFRSISSVAWSPDGKALSFIASKLAKSDIYLYSIADNKTIQLTEDAYTEAVPVWAPDSKKLFFVSNRINDLTPASDIKIWREDYKQNDIYSIDIDTKTIHRLTFDGENSKTSLAVTADGNNIFFVSDKNGIGNVYSLNLLTSAVKPRTNSLNGISQLSINRDGSKLVYSSMNEIGFDVFLLKYPLELSVPGDTLPITRLKSQNISSKLALDKLSEPQTKEKEYKPNDISYGDYKIDMGSQKFVKRNPDARNKEEISSDKDWVIDDFTERAYKVNFSLDAVLGNPGYSSYYGFAGSAVALFSDMLGDHQIYAQMNLFRDLKNSNIGLTYLYLPNIIDYEFSAFHNAAYFLKKNDDYYRFRNFGAAVNASLPFDRFNRIELGLAWNNVSSENVDNADEKTVTRTLLIPSLRYVHDDVLYGWFAPAQGTRYNIGISASPKLQNGGKQFMILDGDLRGYFTIFDYITFAGRGCFGASVGADPRSFYLGGTDNWINRSLYNDRIPLDDPEDFVFMNFKTPLRGYDLGELSGHNYFLTNLEMRFPLFQALVAGPVPILIQGVMGSFFLDMGGAWNGDFKDFRATQLNSNLDAIPRDLRMSAGVGIRGYLLGLPLKLDIAWRNEQVTWSKPRYLVSLGYDF
jgi:Tol biopolymer transport system component